jgi:hypothetical protein
MKLALCCSPPVLSPLVYCVALLRHSVVFDESLPL